MCSHDRTQSAINILKRAVNQFRQSYHDPSELESIGYLVIAENLDKPLEKPDSWEGYIDICLRNAFKKHIVQDAQQNKWRVYLPRVIVDDGNDPGGDSMENLPSQEDIIKEISENEKISELLSNLPPSQRNAVKAYLSKGETPKDKMNFTRAIKKLRAEVTKWR